MIKKNFYIGTVYCRKYIGPEEEYKGQCYIGETTDMVSRNRNWLNLNNTRYGGEKIE